MDQAEGLRILKQNETEKELKAPSSLQITSITGGKGGIGKSNIALNLAIALSRLGEKVCVMDADFGLANIDILLGMKPEFNIGHVFSGVKTLKEIIQTGPGKINFIPASSGLNHLADLSKERLNDFIGQARRLSDDFDRLIIDTPSGISRNVMTFLLASTQIIAIVTPEPTSITDGYALIKSFYMEGGKAKCMILLNMCQTLLEGRTVGIRLQKICQHFIGEIPEFLGAINYDPLLVKSIRRQKALLELYPVSKGAKQINEIALKLKSSKSEENDLGQFFNSLRNFIS